jgi:cell division protein FtsI (penicillin-binding protein 3)/stage V sporulation protein D (sporulation-specific penicillin-binding protein)
MGATNGSVVIMNPQTGAIIAMCNYPDFDPNNYNKVKDISLFNNSVLTGNYEPGSVFKPVTLAAGLDSGKVTPFSGYNDTGLERIAGFNIMNSDGKANGWQTMTQILEKSLNTGTIFVARQVGVDAFRAYVKAFGFGVQTGIDLSPETEGNIKSLDSTGEIYMATGSFGQGLTVTPLQIARAYSAIVNGGRLLVPFVVDKIVAPDGTVTQTTPKVVGQPISEKTSKQVASMLVSVVQNGHAKRAQIPGYLIGGKTGTAQIPDLVNGGYGLDTIHTFAGFGPLSDPRFVIVVKMDKVQKVEFAEGSVIPVFTKIAKYMINYYGIPPEVK